jgi:hypothetical protein
MCEEKSIRSKVIAKYLNSPFNDSVMLAMNAIVESDIKSRNNFEYYSDLSSLLTLSQQLITLASTLLFPEFPILFSTSESVENPYASKHLETKELLTDLFFEKNDEKSGLFITQYCEQELKEERSSMLDVVFNHRFAQMAEDGVKWVTGFLEKQKQDKNIIRQQFEMNMKKYQEEQDKIDQEEKILNACK